MSWKYRGNYGPYDEHDDYFTINPEYVFFSEDISNGIWAI